MKKIIALLLAVLTVAAFAACSSSENNMTTASADASLTSAEASSTASASSETSTVTETQPSTPVATTTETTKPLTPTEPSTTPTPQPIAVTGVNVSISEVTLKEGEKVEISASVLPEEADNKNVTWQSSDETIAVYEEGVIKALKEGSATITVTTEDGSFTASCAVTVESAEPAVNQHIKASIKSSKYEVSEEGEGSVKITGSSKPVSGDVITAEISGHYLEVSAAGISDSYIVYLPDGIFRYTVASNSSAFMPSSFLNKKISFTFSIPTEEEIVQRRNIALNPFDAMTNSVGLPHAESNNIYDQSGQFIARNAIDGMKSNKGHGNYPYESWGPLATVRPTDYFTIDFGREVLLDEVVLYLRADGFGSANSHDAYFSTIVFEFSDGSKVTVNPQKIADAQSFTFDSAKTTTSLKLTGFVTDKSNSQGWAAITEIEAYGSDIIPG